MMHLFGSFLHGDFEEGEKNYMGVPKGFENYYAANIVLLLLQMLYGLKEAAMQWHFGRNCY